MALINSLSLRGKITLAACGVAFLVAVFVILRLATAPSYVTVMTGVDATKSAEITAALSSSGVSGQLVNGGTELQVPKGQEDKAVTALATAGLNTSSTKQAGFSETLDKQKLGASNMQQKIAYQRGLEGEIAQALSKIEGVGEPNVRLTLPDDSTFVGTEDQGGATAAVVLGSGASVLSPGAVRGIANVVASSVPKLSPQEVTITDATGALLWPSGDGVAAGSGGSTSKAAAEASRAQATEARINALLDQTLGDGHARVQVTYDLDMNKVSKEQLDYAKKGTPSRVESGDETMTGSGATPGGTSGVNSNVPTYNGTRNGANGTNKYSQKTRKSEMAVGKTITKTEVASGAINAMQVGLIVDKNLGLTPPQLDSLQQMVATAAGVKDGRDTITATELAFPKQAKAAATGPVPASAMNIIKIAAIAIAVLLFLFFLSRYLRGRERAELMDEPSWLRQLPRPPEPEIVLPETEQAPAQIPVMQTLATSDPRRIALEEVVDHEPERVAAQLRSWITEDGQ